MTTQGKARTAADLLALGFERAAAWQPSGEWLEYRFAEGTAERMTAVFKVNNALYAFCSGDAVLYIGKTTQSLKKRLKGYCKPGSTQPTNQKCHAYIRKALGEGTGIDLLAFAPPEDLQFRGFAINLAGGLEDVLIRSFDPPWNGGAKGPAISETAEREADDLDQDGASVTGVEAEAEIGRFVIVLRPTYFEKGIVNPGKAVSHLFGETDETLALQFSDGAPAVATRIDRRANKSGAVRFIGSNRAIADWFQRHFTPGEAVSARILGPYRVELVAKGDKG